MKLPFIAAVCVGVCVCVWCVCVCVCVCVGVGVCMRVCGFSKTAQFCKGTLSTFFENI